MHNVNGVELTDAQFEEYNKLSTPAEKADYLERHKQLANTSSQESKDAGIKEAEKTTATNSKNGEYVTTIQGVPLTQAEYDQLGKMKPEEIQPFMDNLKKENRQGEVQADKLQAVKPTSTMKESDLPAESWKKPLQEADKAQLEEDKKFTKDTDVYVNNTSGHAVSEDKLPAVLTVGGEDYHSNPNYTVKGLFKAAKKVGWTEKQVKERLDELYPNGWSDNAKKEWENSGYAALEEKKANEVAEATSKKTETKETETPAPTTTTTGSGTGTTPPPAENKDEDKTPPAPEVEVEPVATKEEAKEQSENIDAAIKELETQLANAPDEVTRQELEIRLKDAKHAKELYDSMLVLTDEEIAKRYSSRTGMDDFVKRQRAGGLSGYYKREKSRLKDQLKAAEEAGDDAKVKKLENELKELSGEKGYFIADSVETALKNLASTYAGQAPSATSEWSKKQGDILKAETDRWNQHWNEQMKAIDSDFTQKYEEDDARRAAWNDIKNNEAAQMAAKRLGLLDDTFNAQAAINLQKLFNSKGTADALITMAQMNDYGVEDMAAFVLGRAAKAGNLNLEEVVGNLGEIVSNLGDAAGDLSGSLSDLIEYLTTNGEKHGLKFWEYGK